ncbi:UNVERIFIED_CONTAM: hypothetical protein HDU68_012094 [Siphonaria sp. JEL0065]|nr:hypothetical protein HDU68_012094 [Siphonaria sp. JEL0065]
MLGSQGQLQPQQQQQQQPYPQQQPQQYQPQQQHQGSYAHAAGPGSQAYGHCVTIAPQAPFLVSPGAGPNVPAPTQAELSNLSLVLERLWGLDVNRYEPGKHFALNLQNKTFVSNTNDKAEDLLFKNLDSSLFRQRSTFAKFVTLLDNYTEQSGVAETVSAARSKEEREFIDLISATGPIQYTHKYLIARKLADSDPANFKQQLHQIWFELYKRVVKNDTSAFEHNFAGETRDGEVVGFHNWVTLALKEKAGRAGYRGFILPKSKGGRGPHPTGSDAVLSLQLSWNGDVKPVSTFLIGVSPEYELALCTLAFLAGPEGSPVPVVIDDVNCEVVVHQFTNLSGQKIGSAYVSI